MSGAVEVPRKSAAEGFLFSRTVEPVEALPC